MEIFFSDSDLALIQKQLSYKNVDETLALLTKLPYMIDQKFKHTLSNC